MKMFSIALVSLFAGTVAFADMPPGAMGLPVNPRGIVVPHNNPCNNFRALNAAKQLLATFDAIYHDATSVNAAPFAASAPIIGTCATGQLRAVSDRMARGIMLNRQACGVIYKFHTPQQQRAFANWALDMFDRTDIDTNGATVCAALKPRRVGLPIINGIVVPNGPTRGMPIRR